jgi:small-conductance mechanosensitive channel
MKYLNYLVGLVLFASLVLMLPASSLLAQGDEQPVEPGIPPEEYNQAYYPIEALNVGLPQTEALVNLATPQAAMEYFLINARNNDFQAAARALNLNLVPQDQQAERAPVLAKQIYQVISQQAMVNWDTLPDRPDGQISQPVGGDNALAGEPRRSISLGTVKLDGRDVAIRLQRVKPGTATPVWVFSAQTVENAPALFSRFGPSPLEQRIPNWAQGTSFVGVALWQWIVLAILIALTGVLIWLLRAFIRIVLSRVKNRWLRAMNTTIATPLALALGLFLLSVMVQSLLSLSGPLAGFFAPALWLLVIAALTWLGMRVITYLSEDVARHYARRLSSDNDKKQRQMFTYITVARQVLIVVALLFGVGVALSQFESLEAAGTSLLASASVLGIIVGIAAQAVLGNIIAGMQIAITQPVRLGDNVFFEGQWGYVEEITYTYLTIETWDKRRVIVPLKYFVTNPVENWSKKTAHMIKPIYVYADYRIDVEAVRRKFDELLRNDEGWDGDMEPSVQVTAATEETLELRALCSAKNPSIAWNLHCRMREGLVRYIRDLEDGQFLPRQRLLLANVNGHAPAHNGHDGKQQNDRLLADLLDEQPAGGKQRGPRGRAGRGTSNDSPASDGDH